MELNSNKNKLEIKSTMATVIAIILLALYFIRDFAANQKMAMAVCYIVIIILSACLTMKNSSFFKSVYTLIMMFVLGSFIKYSIPHWSDWEWFRSAFLADFNSTVDGAKIITKVFDTSYIYFYLIGLVLWLVATVAATSVISPKVIYTMRILGIYSLWAIVLHIFTTFFNNYELLGSIIFYVFVISAFWTAYTTKTFQPNGVWKTIILALIIETIAVFYMAEYENLISLFQNMYNMEWYYSLLLALVTFICLLEENIMEDNMIGFFLLGTNVLMLAERNKGIGFELVIVLLFHIVAATAYQYILNTFCVKKNGKYIPDHRIIYGCCYIGAFLLTMFIELRFVAATVLFIICLLILLIYYGKNINIEGKIYGTILVGAAPCLLLEVTMASLGKSSASLSGMIIVTIMFWCVCGVALSWKESCNIKSVVIEKAAAKSIVSGLSAISYFLTLVLLFI